MMNIKNICSLTKYSFLASFFIVCTHIYYKSLSQAEEQRPTILQNVLYFNRIPKTGSENFVFVLRTLAKVSRLIFD